MGNILNKLHIWYEKFMKFNFPQEEVEPIPPIDGDFHADKIRRYGDNLRDTKLPLEDRGKAAHYIGLLAYTGGVSCGAPASEYIQDMINILIMPESSRKMRIAVLKGLCGVCYINYTNQNAAKELHLADILLAFLDEEEDEDSTDDEQDIIIVKFWVCYLMTVVSCNNLPYLKLFQDSGGQMLENRLESLSSMEWFGWPANYAEIMLSLLGYQKIQLN
ncbi:armadillo-like helical domain-containing protein 2 [Eublepharis macularius]|uniref:Armadillo-like helical domain-containing protein 2 n=1 Tax=Eublepharis macularius TaxID=481883 RepID=A0AA97JPC0_EUBMA|nr:armadillo-like helical domain-containing protein 2 [Eublepharis macularius]